MSLFRICVAMLITTLLTVQLPDTDANYYDYGYGSSKPRVRRSWTALSASDRKLYLDAIASAMDSGAYIKFVEIHTEMMSEMEAHRQCMFVYWHRILLVVFENMLRAQGPKYKDITIPYWDWMTDFNAFASGQCKNVLDCSPALKYVGGLPPISNGMKSMTINSDFVSGYCENDSPLNHFCESSLVSGAKCAKCLPRNDWSKVNFPDSASYASVRAQVFGAKNLGEVSKAIEEGGHNQVHGALGSTMGTYASPADPIFWSHHAMVDLLHSIFHKCKVGEQKLTLDQKIKSVDWTSCERRNGGVFNPLDYATMRTGYQGKNPIDATNDPLIGKYFANVPRQFVQLMDTRDLGANSYSYEVSGMLGTMYSKCGATKRRLESRHLRTMEDAPPQPTSTIANTTYSDATKKMLDWVDDTDKIVKTRYGNPIQEAEKMACLFQDECLGGVTTYTAEFKRRFCITQDPRCKRIVDRIYRRQDSVKITEWKKQMTKTFGCPKPKTYTPPPTPTHYFTPTPTPTSYNYTPVPTTTKPTTYYPTKPVTVEPTTNPPSN